MGIVLAQEVGDVFMALFDRGTEGGFAVWAFGVDVGVISQQQFHHVFVAGAGSQMKRRPAKVVLGVNLRLVGQEQLGDIFAAA